MPGNEFLTRETLGHGAYLCVRATDGATSMRPAWT